MHITEWLKSVDPNLVVTGNIYQIKNTTINFVDLEDAKETEKIQSSLKLTPNCIMLFSDEWLKRQEQCKSTILARMGVFNRRINGRDCEIKETPKHLAKEFLEKYHIQGSNNLSLVYFGIYHQDELMGIMSLGRHSRQIAQNRIVLDRLCFKSGVQVVGGCGKLFKRCIKWAIDRDYDEIVSFSDNRWGSGTVYKNIGFVLEITHRSDYCYVDPTTGIRHSKQSQKKSSSNCPESFTEFEWASHRGLLRIYDWGKKRWTFNLKPDANDTWKDKKSKQCANQHKDGVFKHSHIRGFFPSAKNNTSVYFGSSYELRCIYVLENDPTVKSFRRCDAFKGSAGWRNPDLFVELTDDTQEIWEIKPETMLKEENVKNQIKDSDNFAKSINVKFKIWTEKDSGLKDEKEIISWAKKYLLETQGDKSFIEQSKENNRKSSKKYYDRILSKKIEVWCSYCKENHYVTIVNYKINIKNNKDYICEKHGGYISGKKPKPHLRKDNPFAHENKKQCTGKGSCGRILPLSEFGPKSSKTDVLCSLCKECRAKIYKEKYIKKGKAVKQLEAPRKGAKYKGISFSAKKNQYKARICVGKTEIHLGWFRIAEQAAENYDFYAIKIFGRGNCYLNFPDKDYTNFVPKICLKKQP